MMICAPDNGNGSIRIGATGKVSDLMTRELESIKSSSSKETRSTSHKTRTQSAPVSISCGGVSTWRLQQTSQGTTPKKKNSIAGRRTSSHLPMLGSDEISMDTTPNRGDHKPEKKKAVQIVEIVDLKCGSSNPDGPSWSSPIGNQLRRLSFSKLSD